MGTGGHGGMSTGGMGGAPAGCPGPKTGADTCNGEAIILTPGSTVTLCGSIDASTAADYIGSGCAIASQASKDRVYDVTAAGEGVLSIDVRADGSGLDPFFHLNIPNSCGDPSPASSGGCFEGMPSRAWWDGSFVPGFHLILEGGVDANQNPLTGDYVIEMSLQPPTCGDWVTYGSGPLPEQCDDGNTLNGDGCDSNCQLTVSPVPDACPGVPLAARIASTASVQGRLRRQPRCRPGVTSTGTGGVIS